jgi:hypothetical protein
MAYQLVGAALNPHWARLLSHTERIVLYTMAHAANDVPTMRSANRARQYWAGWEVLAITLDGDLAPKGTPAYRTAERRIRKIIARLVGVGAIERIEHATGRQHARYLVALDLAAVDNSGIAGCSAPSNSTNSRVLRGPLFDG